MNKRFDLRESPSQTFFSYTKGMTAEGDGNWGHMCFWKTTLQTSDFKSEHDTSQTKLNGSVSNSLNKPRFDKKPSLLEPSLLLGRWKKLSVAANTTFPVMPLPIESAYRRMWPTTRRVNQRICLPRGQLLYAPRRGKDFWWLKVKGFDYIIYSANLHVMFLLLLIVVLSFLSELHCKNWVGDRTLALIDGIQRVIFS